MIQDKFLDKLEYWINERQRILNARNSGAAKPWSSDEIFQKYHFCNVHREDDRGTKEIHAMRVKLDPHFHELPTFYTCARLFNRADSVEHFFEKGPDFLKELRGQGYTVFNTAYVVSTCGATMDKVDYVTQVVRAVDEGQVSTASCTRAFQDIRKVRGLGSFLAGQVVADLKYTPYLCDAPDFEHFAVMGPGSKKGMDHIFGGGTTEGNFHDRLVLLRQELGDNIPKMHNQDLQNCLCEFSKYIRYLTGAEGRQRPYNALH